MSSTSYAKRTGAPKALLRGGRNQVTADQRRRLVPIEKSKRDWGTSRAARTVNGRASRRCGNSTTRRSTPAGESHG